MGMRFASYLSQFKSALNRAFAALIFVVAIYVFYKSRGSILSWPLPSFSDQLRFLKIPRTAVGGIR